MTPNEPGFAARGPRLVVVSGPSGVGKSSVVAEVRRLRPEVLVSVSATTRIPRAGERNGEHYHFVEPAEFARMVHDQEFLEHADYAGNRYGTPAAPVRSALVDGRDVLLEIELQGARQVRRSMPDALLVMLLPPSWDVLVSRLAGRGTEDPAVLARRLDVARTELAAADEFDERIVNDEVRAAAHRLVSLLAVAPSAFPCVPDAR